MIGANPELKIIYFSTTKKPRLYISWGKVLESLEDVKPESLEIYIDTFELEVRLHEEGADWVGFLERDRASMADRERFG